MSSWSDRRPSTVTMSGWPAVHTVVRNFPSNMREGDLTASTYLSVHTSTKASSSREGIVVRCSLAFPPQSDPRPAETFL
jgi:hypothetical protein